MRTEKTAVLGAELKRLRESRGWSLRKLASETTFDFGFHGKAERGESASLDFYETTARALGADLRISLKRRRPAA